MGDGRVSFGFPSSRACALIFVQYVPAPQESVTGVALGRSGEGWRVDIGSAHPALLDGLAFEGASKRSKPNLKVRSAPCQIELWHLPYHRNGRGDVHIQNLLANVQVHL